ncbi:MAG: hypothetical protein IPL47_15025 [Phyllobacteriaceae bacterium]|nr:hypothetical protein [Phyllobacteriaceae bacterium]
MRFAALDIDLYPFLESDDEIDAFMKAWADPCLIARTKSNGIHVYAFFDEWIDEDEARKYIEAQRDRVLSGEALANSKEVFPKPVKDGGLPPQINLPQCGDSRPVLRGLAGTAGPSAATPRPRWATRLASIGTRCRRSAAYRGRRSWNGFWRS